MLPKWEWGERGSCHGPLVVMCHWLGGSAETWSLLAERLAERGLRCVAVDLPGFGAAGETPGYSVREMVDAVIATVQEIRTAEADIPWLLAGHSLGGKIAAVVAREAVNGAAGLQGLRGVVLMAASPPGPEPMKGSQRAQNLRTIGQSTGDSDQDWAHAKTFVTDNAGEPALGENTLRAATEGVARARKAAIRAWFESGSKEDWREFVGELPVPALVFAGSEDAELGPETQRALVVPCFASGEAGGLDGGELVVLEGAGHLLPLERPGAVAERMVEFCAELGLPVRRQVRVSERFEALVSSDFTSTRTRALLHERLVEDDAMYEPRAVGRRGLRVLRELARRVVPGIAFDLAARVDRRLAGGVDDGWRPDELPADCVAWRRGLASLEAAANRAHGIGFAELNDELQDALLEEASAGKLGKGLGARLLQAVGVAGSGDEGEIYNAAEMTLWFEEVRGEVSKLYMADPRTMERIGFAGFADERGFTQIRLGEREVWER